MHFCLFWVRHFRGHAPSFITGTRKCFVSVVIVNEDPQHVKIMKS